MNAHHGPSAVSAVVVPDVDNFRAPLDMHEVARQALSKKHVWRLEIECHGAPFHWTGEASSEGAATLKAMADLSDSHPEFNRYKARVSACSQVT